MRTKSGERGSAVGDRASAVGGHGGPPKDQDDQVRRWQHELCKMPRPEANCVQWVWRWGGETCIALHPHSSLWPLLREGTFRGQRLTRAPARRAPFFLFTPEVSMADLVDHYASARDELMALIRNGDRRGTGRLLDDVPRRLDAPGADRSSRPSLAADPVELGSNAPDKMMGLIAKWNLQYRRPWPLHEMLPHGEIWSTIRVRDLPYSALEVLFGPNFSVGWEELRQTSVWGRHDVADMALPSSMIIPLWSRSTVGGKWVADEFAMVRRVLAISFPQLCLALKDQYSAKAIEQAWETFPIVSDRKSSGGPPSAKSRRTRFGRRRR